MKKNKCMIAFVREAMQDAKKIKWPTKKQVIKYTAIVLVLSLIISMITSVIGVGVEQAISLL